MVKALMITTTYQITAHNEEIQRGESYLADVTTSPSGELLALDVRTHDGRRILPHMGSIRSVVEQLRDARIMRTLDADRYIDEPEG